MTIYNVRIYTQNKNRDIIEKGYVSFENGVITNIGAGAYNEISDGDLDGEGKTLYPGFIDAHTHLGLTTNGVGMESEDFNEESEPVSPQLRICDGINPFDISFSEAVKAGITSAVVSPGSMNPVAGDIAAVSTVGKRVDKMLLRTVGMKFALGENPKMTYMNRDETPCTRMAVSAMIRETLAKAKRYMEDKEAAEENGDELPDLDIKSEALIPLLKRKVKAHFHCHRADDIFTAVRLAKEFGLDYVLVHCTDGHLIADELAQEKALAVVGPVMCDACKPELANITPENAGILAQSKVKTAVCTDHSETPIQYLPLTVGICIKHGLSFQQAVDSVTINAAEIAGIDDLCGSVELGKRADLVMFEGNPFEVMSSPSAVFAGGKRQL
ncbi:amidohydrolase [Ruminococcus sp. Marseille-P6503]|uniref:amidohydrolase n=1 Tax=Ruminococcus sp. Marseille-P6503 TaxID=2364796 RepID=UPI000F53CC7C|nr:amidohydrolase [Ruminococcus sp. Marseille-P6503]